MKKRNGLIVLLGGFIILFSICWLEKNREVFWETDREGNVVVSLRIGEEKQQIYPYYDLSSDVYYFFLPAFVKENKIYNDSLKLKNLYINGKEILPFHSMQWEEGIVYSVVCNDVGGVNGMLRL